MTGTGFGSRLCYIAAVDIDYYTQYFSFERNDWWFIARRRIVLELMSIHLAGAPGPLRVLDAGCGTGITLQHLEEFGTTIGVDNEPVAINFCRIRQAERLACAPLERLPFADDSFDVVTCLDVIEHIEHDDAAVAEMARVIRPGGLIVLTVPAFRLFWSDHDVINHHKRRYRRRRIREMIGESFDFEVLSYYNTHLFPIAFAVRMLKKIEMAVYPSATRKVVAENTYLPRSVNALFAKIFSSEIFWLKRTSLPIGLSIICVARRKHASADSLPTDDGEPSARSI